MYKFSCRILAVFSLLCVASLAYAQSNLDVRVEPDQFKPGDKLTITGTVTAIGSSWDNAEATYALWSRKGDTSDMSKWHYHGASSPASIGKIPIGAPATFTLTANAPNVQTDDTLIFEFGVREADDVAHDYVLGTRRLFIRRCAEVVPSGCKFKPLTLEIHHPMPPQPLKPPPPH
jgi:hypothetical protein